MVLEVTHPDMDKLIRELVRFTGETVSQAIVNSVHERLVREQQRQSEQKSIKHELLRIGRECAALPVLDSRSADEIIGYNSIGIPI